MRNELRTQMQEKAVNELLSWDRVILEWGTGVGKTRVAVNAVDRIFRENKEAKILLAVQETAHKTNWRKEFLEVLGEERGELLYSRIVVDCYASLKNHMGTRWDLFIADEGHHLRGDNRINIVTTIESDRVLFLSATINDRGDGQNLLEAINSHFGVFHRFSYDINDAIDDGILAEPEIHVLAVNLTENTRKRYDTLSQYMESCKKDYFIKREEYGLQGKDPDNDNTLPLYNRWMIAAGRRKRYTSAIKTSYAASLIKTLDKKGTRYICFCGDINQVKKLGGENYICSKKTAKENKEAISAFDEGQTNRLFSVGMIREGQNLKGIEAGIIIQLDSKERNFKQMFGRVMRSLTPILYMLYVPGTQDEVYLQNALADTSQEYIKGWNKPTLSFGKDKEQEYALPVFDREISRSGICCELYNEMFALRDDVFFLSPGQTRLEGHKGKDNIYADEITGHFKDVYYNQRQGTFEFILSNNRIGLIDISLQWDRAFGLLMPLSNLNGAKEKGICIETKMNGNYLNLECYLGTEKIFWPKALKGIPQDRGEKINLINNLIANIKI